MSDDTNEPKPEVELPKYRLLPIHDEISITEGFMNELSKQGYELQAVSGNFMLMLLPSVDHLHALATRMLEERYGAENPAPPGEGQNPLDFSDFD